MRFATRCRDRKNKGFQPRLEPLEDRWCLSVTVTTIPIPSGNLLKIEGDSAADVVNITDQGDGNVAVTDGSSNPLGSASNVSRIVFDGEDGTDTVNYTLANALTQNEAVKIELGSGGNGTVNLDLSQGVNGAKLGMNVEGNVGNDTISATLGSLTAANVGLHIDGAAGDDTITVTGAGANISTDSSLCLALCGGQGADTMTTTYQGQILGKFNYGAMGGAGDDTITGDITIDSDSTGKVCAVEIGGQDHDTVTLNVNDNSGGGGSSTLKALHAVIFDFGAEDTLTNTDNVKVVSNHGENQGDPHCRDKKDHENSKDHDKDHDDDKTPPTLPGPQGPQVTSSLRRIGSQGRYDK